MREINITGGGLAGLALARLLRRESLAVTVVEAGAYPRHRVCGEFINGLSEGEIDALELKGVVAGQPRHRETVWYCGDRLAGRRELPTPAIGISRWKLDADMAADLVARGGVLKCGERGAVDAAAEGHVLTCGRRRGPARWLGLKAHYTDLQMFCGLEMHLGNGGYAGLTAVEGGRVNVCALLPAAAAARVGAASALPAALRRVGLDALARRLENAQVDDASVTGISHLSLGWDRTGSGGSLTLGDRAAVIPPFTGNGMSMAMQSALCAAPFLTAWAFGEMPWPDVVRRTREAIRRRFARRMSLAPKVQPFLIAPGLRRLSPLLLRSGVLPFEWLFHRLR